MEAIILAGGFGTRMRPLTYTRPKPLLPILNRPLLQAIIDRMPKAVEIGRYRNVDADAVGIYLSRPAPPKPGAFEVVNYPDASTLYLYRDGKFQGVEIGG